MKALHWHLVRVLAVCLCLGPSLACHAQTKRALLIGIDVYAPEGRAIHAPAPATKSEKFYDKTGSRWDLPTWPNLSGAVADARAMRNLLTSPKFGFPNDAVHIHILTNGQATRGASLEAMQKYLVDEPAKGDTVVFYYAGHGSQRYNSKSTKPDHLDETIVPADARTGEYDIRDKEIARILNKALDKGIRLTAIFDSCHSGTIARGIPMGSLGTARFLGYDPRDADDPPDTNAGGTPVVRPEDRTDNAALVFTATQHDQFAREWEFEGEQHGAFTVALIEALNSLPASTPARDVYKRVKVVMQGMGLADQQPVLGGTTERLAQPLLGAGSSSTRFTVAVAPEGVLNDGRVVLDGGLINGLGQGSELVRRGDTKGAQPVHIRISEVEGPNKSIAEVLSQPGEKIEAGDLFELDRWVPAEHSRLRVWMPLGNLTAAQLEDFAAELVTVRESNKIGFVEDPVLTRPTHMLSWDGKSWMLAAAGGAAKSLSDNPKAEQIISAVGGGGQLFVDLPPSKEFSDQLKIAEDTNHAVETVRRPELAQYLLTGRLNGSSLEYSWVRKDVIEQAKTSAAPLGQGESVCSGDSPFPSRTDWIDASLPVSPQKLTEYALRLVRIRSWLQLPVPPGGGDSDFPYRLVLKRRGGEELKAVDSGIVAGKEIYDLVLHSDNPVPPTVSRQWVYVLGIDCSGAGKLLYPLLTAAEGNQKPDRGQFAQDISLTGSGNPIRIIPPFGVDTYILLTTSEQLPDPGVLNFQGVLTRGERAPSSPLQDLLGSASAGTRGMDRPMPSNWSVQFLQTRSVPNRAEGTVP